MCHTPGTWNEGCRQSPACARCPSNAKHEERKWLRLRPTTGCADSVKGPGMNASKKGAGCHRASLYFSVHLSTSILIEKWAEVGNWSSLSSKPPAKQRYAIPGVTQGHMHTWLPAVFSCFMLLKSKVAFLGKPNSWSSDLDFHWLYHQGILSHMHCKFKTASMALKGT